MQGRYPPASTIKPAIGMYGLSNNIVNWDFEIKDPGFFTLPETGKNILEDGLRGAWESKYAQSISWSAQILTSFLACI